GGYARGVETFAGQSTAIDRFLVRVRRERCLPQRRHFVGRPRACCARAIPKLTAKAAPSADAKRILPFLLFPPEFAAKGAAAITSCRTPRTGGHARVPGRQTQAPQPKASDGESDRAADLASSARSGQRASAPPMPKAESPDEPSAFSRCRI